MNAFGKPGLNPCWTAANKGGVGTAYCPYNNKEVTSKVWFSLSNGIITEVYYPQIDVAQIKTSQILITDEKTFLHQESKDTLHKTELIDSQALAYRVINKDKKGRYVIVKSIVTDPLAQTLFLKIEIRKKVKGLKFYLLHHPQLNNLGLRDNARVEKDFLACWHKNSRLTTYQVVKGSKGFSKMSVGYRGQSCGYEDLKNFKMDYEFKRALAGNVVLTAEIDSLELAIGFGKSLKEAEREADWSLSRGFEKIARDYINGWRGYLNKLTDLSRYSHDKGKLFYISAALLKAHEDKTRAGAVVASLSIPWGDGFNKLRVKNIRGHHGYHVVWPRDHFQTGTAFLALGDYSSARACLDYLKKIQYKKEAGAWRFGKKIFLKEGAFPQNCWVDGETVWQSLQMDEVAFPVILTWRLWKKGIIKIVNYWGLVRRAADFVVRYGPWTPQERWEENHGISPSTLAAEIGALICAGEIARFLKKNNLARAYFKKAAEWRGNIEKWTYTTTGPWADGKYYIRIAGSLFKGTQRDYEAPWDPNTSAKTWVANKGGPRPLKAIVDAGFLELVRYGIRKASDSHIRGSLPVIDQKIRVVTPQGPGWYRYLYDAYGDGGKGRLWTFLTGERGLYELAYLLETKTPKTKIRKKLKTYIRAMEKFASPGGLLCEQIWDEGQCIGQPTNAATPLVWSHAEYIKLLRSVRDNKVFDCLR